MIKLVYGLSYLLTQKERPKIIVRKRWHKTAIIWTAGAIGAALIILGAPPLGAWIEAGLTKLMR